MIKIIESPREGMQSLHHVIPIALKVNYINRLLRVGFDTVELGSIVSPKIIPQMADSLELLYLLDFSGVSSNRMFLAVSAKGIGILTSASEVTHIAYPFSFSPTFLKLNVNSSVEDVLETVRLLISTCRENGKTPVVYISMAFGNPYNDPWSMDDLVHWTGILHGLGVRIIPLSNVSEEIGFDLIREVYSTLIPMFPDVEFGLHLHTSNMGWYEKVDAAYNAGCRRFDGVMNGYGGCPMSGKEYLGNLKTENLVEFAEREGIPLNINKKALSEVSELASKVFQVPSPLPSP